jgi:23S rRNA pseudouridine2604 synthase
MSDPARLDKRIIDMAGCSREDARRYIEGGWVAVDGCLVEEPQALVTADQRIEIAADARPDEIEPATFLVHKPAGMDFMATPTLVHPARQAKDDDSAIRIVKRHFHRLTPLMPLDVEASGLVVVSQDGRARRRLTEDYGQIEQEFIIEVAGTLVAGGLERLAHGLRYQARSLPPCKVSWQNETRLRFAIKAVQPGQLRHMCRIVGLDVISMRRIRIGRIPLRKLAVDEWRYLPVGEKF